MCSNFLIVTLDSCRWDVFAAAELGALRTLVHFEESEALGTYTLPSHISMLQGHFPHCHRRIPYFNRFVKSVFRINMQGLEQRPSFTSFPAGTRNIVTGLRVIGYQTLVVGAVGWFESKILTEDFQYFHFTGIDVKTQQEIVLDFVDRHAAEPLFVLWNVGETHDPFEYGGRIEEAATLRQLLRQGAEYDPVRTELLLRKQRLALEYVAPFVAETIARLDRLDSTCVPIVCSDHGECFGEDGRFGHGFHHPCIMKVPLGIRLSP